MGLLSFKNRTYPYVVNVITCLYFLIMHKTRSMAYGQCFELFLKYDLLDEYLYNQINIVYFLF